MTFQINNSISYRVHLICFLWLFLIPPDLVPGWFYGKFAISIFLVGLVFLLKKKVAITAKERVFFFFPIIILILTILALSVSLDRVIWDDLFELSRPLSFALFLAFYFDLAKKNIPLSAIIFRPLSIIVSFFFIIFCFQKFQISGLSSIHLYYIRDNAVLANKFVGSFQTTYIAGFFMVSCFCLFLSRSIIIKKRRVFNLLIVLMSGFLVLHTQSRSAFFALLVVALFFVLIFVWINIKNPVLVFSFLFVFPFFVYINYGFFDSFLLQFGYLYGGLKAYVFNFSDNVYGSGSLGVRVSQIEWALENNKNILIGEGILKADVRLLESWFSLYYFRYGVFGMISYLFYWFSIGFLSFYSYKKFFRFGYKESASYLLGFSAVVVALPVSFTSSAVTDFPVTNIFYAALSAIAINHLRFYQSSPSFGRALAV